MHKGVFYLLLSALSFALSTVFAKIIITQSKIPAIELTFFRFAAGFAVILIYITIQRKPVVPNKISYVLLRAVFNTLAVLCFFIGITYTTITNANMLNMTYPIFVFLIAPFLNKEKTSLVYFFYLAITMAGVVLFVIPGETISLATINKGDMLALLSGLFAGFAITSLRESRKYDESYMILFYLMAFGTILNTVLVIPYFIFPSGIMLIYVILTTLVSVLGQVFLTTGYRYIDASAGSLVSSSRIIFAAFFGIVIFSDHITLRMFIGGILILSSLLGISGAWKLIFRNRKKV